MAHLKVRTKIRIDKSSSKIFQQEAKTYIRKQLETLQLDIKFLDSKSANLIQLADMISGAICRKYAQPAKPQWIYKIKDKVCSIEIFG